MTLMGYDTSFTPPSPESMARAGYTYVGRYVGPGSGKLLGPAELARIRATTLGLLLLVELDTNDTDHQAPQGRANATSALAHCRSLGLAPAGGLRYYSADENITPDNLAPAVDYFRGVVSVEGRPVGAYCDAELAAELTRLGLVVATIRPGASSWSTHPFPFDAVQGPNGVHAYGGEFDELRGTPPGLYLTTTPQEHPTMRYIFDPAVDGDGKHVYVTDGLRYRIQPLAWQVDQWATAAGAGPIVHIDKFPADDWDNGKLVESLCGKPDPGEHITADNIGTLDVTLTGTATATPAS